MSSIEDRADEFLKEEIDLLISLQDEEIRLGERKTEIIERMVQKLEAKEVDPEKICSIIKNILRKNFIEISDKTVERACGMGKKRLYDRYQSPAKSDIMSDFQQPVTVSTSGSQSVTGPEGNEKEEEQELPLPSITATDRETYDSIAEASAEIALTTINTLKDELIEKLALLDDKDKRIEELEIERGNFEIELGTLKNKPLPKNVDQLEELQIQLDEAKQTIEEYKEIERLRVQKQDFQPASKVTSPPTVWVAAINALNLFKGLKEGSTHAINHNDPWRKVLFDVADDGQLKNARLEEV